MITALDIETYGSLYPWGGEIVGVGIASDVNDYNESTYTTGEKNIEELLTSLSQKQTPLIAYNLQYEMLWFNYKYPHLKFNWVGDSAVMALLENNSDEVGEDEQNLKSTTQRMFCVEPYEKELKDYIRSTYKCKVSEWGKYIGISPVDLVGQYCRNDCWYTLKIWNNCSYLLNGREHLMKFWIEEIEATVCQNMYGCPVDRPLVLANLEQVQTQIRKAYAVFFENEIVKTHMPTVSITRFLKDEYYGRYTGLKAFEKFPLTPEEFIQECNAGTFKAKYGVSGKSIEQYIQENPFNPNSTTQLQMFFEETKLFWDEKHQRHIWPLLTEKGAASFTEDSIYKYGEVGYILHSAIEVKKVSEKLVKLEEDSRHQDTAHFSINTVATKTGRISGNGLNIPACPFDNPLFGSCLISGEGASIVSVDYASLEPFLAAVLSKDPLLLYAIDGGIGKSPFTKNGVLMIDDPYIMLGSVIKNFQAKIEDLVTPEAWLADSEAVKKLLKAERFIMKVTFLSSLYGAQPPKVLETLLKEGVKITFKEVSKIVDDMNSLFAGLTLFKHQVKQKALYQGFINNPLGFPCHVQNTASHKIFNKYIQSTAAMVMKFTVSSLWSRIKNREEDMYPLIINLHDAFFLRVRDENIDEVKSIIFDQVLPEVNAGLDFCANLRMSIDIGKNFYQVKG